MSKAIGYILVGVTTFFSGVAVGWIAKKKTSQLIFEEITPEEQAEQILSDAEKETTEIKRPVDIQAAIDKTFGVANSALDTQKEQFWNKWKSEKTAEQYDTRTKEEPENVVVSEEEDISSLEEGMDKEFLNSISGGPNIEEGTMEDWEHWMGRPDGDYDPIEVWWYEKDNVLTDNNGEPLENPGKYMGFDVAAKFREISPDTTGDNDIRVIFNHKTGTIYQIVRKPGNYAEPDEGGKYGGYGDDTDGDEWILHRR